jgi:thiamine pyrophosphate-dependent acetolactate synthase large subunit-like protein
MLMIASAGGGSQEIAKTSDRTRRAREIIATARRSTRMAVLEPPGVGAVSVELDVGGEELVLPLLFE